MEFIREECDQCAKELHNDPAWLRGRPAMGWEAYPNKYKKKWKADGTPYYEATEEFRQDTLEKLQKRASDEAAAEERAIAKKRAERRKESLKPHEVEAALNRWRPKMEQRAKEEIEQKQLARLQWLMP
jgi:hypothetical protein